MTFMAQCTFGLGFILGMLTGAIGLYLFKKFIAK